MSARFLHEETLASATGDTDLIALIEDIVGDEQIDLHFRGDHTAELKLKHDDDNGVYIPSGKNWESGPYSADAMRSIGLVLQRDSATAVTITFVLVG